MRAVVGCLLSLLLTLAVRAAPALAAPPYPPQGEVANGLVGLGIGSGLVLWPVAQPVLAMPVFSGGPVRIVPRAVPVLATAIGAPLVVETVRGPAVATSSVTLPLLAGPAAQSVAPLLVAPRAPAVSSPAAAIVPPGRELSPSAAVPATQPARAIPAAAPATPVTFQTGATSAALHTPGGPVASAGTDAGSAGSTTDPALPPPAVAAAGPAAVPSAAVGASIQVGAPPPPIQVMAAIANPASSEAAGTPLEPRTAPPQVEMPVVRIVPVNPANAATPRAATESVPSATALILKTARNGPEAAGDLVRRALGVAAGPATEDLSLGSAPSPSEAANEPASAMSQQPAQPLSGPMPDGSSSVGAGGHGGTSIAACLQMLLLLSSFLFCLRRRASNCRRPLSLTYAPLVPPG